MRQVEKTVRLHKVQAAFQRSNARHRAFCGGRGSGKSWAGAYDMIRRAQRGRTYLIGSPTGILLNDTTFPTFEAVARELGVWNPANVRLAPYPTVLLTTGATIRFRTAENPERMRGPNLSGIWLDEASLMDEAAFKICIACLREFGEAGFLSATFTPKGLAHWTYKVFGTRKPDTELFHAKTYDNPFNPPEFYEKLAAHLTAGEIAQELEGEFLDDDDALKVIPSAWVRAAQARWQPGPPQGMSLDAIGVDVARGGCDKTVIASRYGAWWDKLRKYAGKATPDGPAVASLVTMALKPNQRALVCIDLDGVGGSPFDWLKRTMPDIRLLGVHGGAKVEAKDRTGTLIFANLRAYGYWCLRELLDPANKADIALPPDSELLADLTAPRWEMTTRGVQIESKDEIKKRLGRSTDVGDSVVYSILLPRGAVR